jgi:uncharacterized membrane-anchored protein
MRNKSLLHFLSYFAKDTWAKVFGLFTLVVLIIFVPGMYLVDKYQERQYPGHKGSAGETATVIYIVLGAIWIAILTYNIYSYKRYVRNRA